MILILHQADFSGNNIGKIDIDPTMAQPVVEMMERYTKYSPSVADAHALALNALYKALNTAGIWAKIKLLCLPAYANNLGECYKDAKAGSIQDTTLATYYELTGGKLKYLSTTPSQDGKNYGYPVTGASDDCCIFGLMDTPADQDGGWGVFNWGITTNYITPGNNAISRYIGSAPVTQVRAGGSAIAPGGAAMISGLVQTGAFLLNFKDGYITFRNGESPVIASATITQATLDKFVPLPYLSPAAGHARTQYGLYLYGCAEGLSDAQMTTLYNALTAFYDTL